MNFCAVPLGTTKMARPRVSRTGLSLEKSSFSLAIGVPVASKQDQKKAAGPEGTTAQLVRARHADPPP